MDNLYSLTLEGDLDAKYLGDIATFWNKVGQRCDFVTPAGVKIAAIRFHKPENKVGIVIVNGRTESFLKYKETAFDLWKNGYSVYTYDHRGQGLSAHLLKDAPQIGHVERFEDYVDDLTQLVEECVKPIGHDELIVFAHSMGGGITSMYLEEVAEKSPFICGVLFSPMHEINPGRYPGFAAEAVVGLNELLHPDHYAPGCGDYRDDERFGDSTVLTHSATRYAIMRKEFSDHPDAKLGGPSVNWLHEAFRATRYTRHAAGKVSVPLLILQAGDDTAVLPQGQELFCKLKNDAWPNSCRIDRLDGAFHELMAEVDEYRIPALSLALDFLVSNAGRD